MNAIFWLFKCKGDGNDVATRTQLRTWWIQIEARLLALAGRLVKDPHLAQDVVQDVALEAISWEMDEHQTAFSSAEHLERWAFRRTYWRSFDRLGSKPFAPLESDVSDKSQIAPEEQVIQDQTVAHIREIVHDLPERQRAVIEGLLQGKTHKELAGELSISEDTVRSLKRYAIGFISRRLSERKTS